MSPKLLTERNLKSLRIFCAAAEAGGFSAAEKTLSLSKASISRHIREIEEVLGVKLCERGPSGFKLTVSGLVALKNAQTALEAMSRIKMEVDNVRGILSGKIRVGIVEHIIAQFDLPQVLKAFTEQAPDVAANVRVMTFSQLNQALRERNLDVAIRGMYEEDSFFDFHPLFFEYQRLYVREGQAVEGLPLIYRPHPFIYELMGTHKYEKGPTASGLEAIACLIASGRYVGILPESYAREVSAHYPLAEVEDAAAYTNTVCAIVEKYRPPSASIDLFVDILKRYGRIGESP